MLHNIVSRLALAGVGALMLLNGTMLLAASHNPPPPAPWRLLGTISGRVLTFGDKPVVGCTVIAYYASTPFERFARGNPNTAITDRSGRYVIHFRAWFPGTTGGPYLARLRGLIGVALEAPADAPPGPAVDLRNAQHHHVGNVNLYF